MARQVNVQTTVQGSRLFMLCILLLLQYALLLLQVQLGKSIQ